MSTPRVRFAPSPTGHMHLGNARTALYNWMFARHAGGVLVLRIEDTDRTRHDESAVDVILEGLRWLGIDWDEGPTFQSDRLDLYQAATDRLLAQDLAYREDDPERGSCVRLRIPPGRSAFDDLVLGPTAIDHADIEAFVIQKADGFPTYNFACVVDDIDMNITHVVRGVGHTTNTHAQRVVYQALGAEPPLFAHMPLILGTDGKPYSKRHGAVSITDFMEAGYLSEALANFIALLGWSPGNDEEILPMAEMIRRFELTDVKKANSQLDPDKLDWMNGKYIREMAPEALVEQAIPFLDKAGLQTDRYDADTLVKMIGLYREKLKRLDELPGKCGYFFVDRPKYNDATVDKVLRKPGVPERLVAIARALTDLPDFSEPTLASCLEKIAETEGVGFGKIAQPIRVALTGDKISPGIYETMSVLGRQAVLDRLLYTIEQIVC